MVPGCPTRDSSVLDPRDPCVGRMEMLTRSSTGPETSQKVGASKTFCSTGKCERRGGALLLGQGLAGDTRHLRNYSWEGMKENLLPRNKSSIHPAPGPLPSQPWEDMQGILRRSLFLLQCPTPETPPAERHARGCWGAHVHWHAVLQEAAAPAAQHRQLCARGILGTRLLDVPRSCGGVRGEGIPREQPVQEPSPPAL